MTTVIVTTPSNRRQKISLSSSLAFTYGTPFFENAIRYMVPGGPQAAGPTTIENPVIMPVAGTVAQLQIKFVNVSVSSSGGATITFTVRKNGIATSMALTFTAAAEGATLAYKVTTTGSFTVVAGDLISIKFQDSNWGSAGGAVMATILVNT